MWASSHRGNVRIVRDGCSIQAARRIKPDNGLRRTYQLGGHAAGGSVCRLGQMLVQFILATQICVLVLATLTPTKPNRHPTPNPN